MNLGGFISRFQTHPSIMMLVPYPMIAPYCCLKSSNLDIFRHSTWFAHWIPTYAGNVTMFCWGNPEFGWLNPSMSQVSSGLKRFSTRWRPTVRQKQAGWIFSTGLSWEIVGKSSVNQWKYSGMYMCMYVIYIYTCRNIHIQSYIYICFNIYTRV